MKTFKEIYNKIKETDVYHVEGAKLDFAIQLGRILDAIGMSRSDLAVKLGKTRSYVTKIMRGDANLTLASMVSLSKAVGGSLSVHIEHPVISVSPEVPCLTSILLTTEASPHLMDQTDILFNNIDYQVGEKSGDYYVH